MTLIKAACLIFVGVLAIDGGSAQSLCGIKYQKFLECQRENYARTLTSYCDKVSSIILDCFEIMDDGSCFKTREDTKAARLSFLEEITAIPQTNSRWLDLKHCPVVKVRGYYPQAFFVRSDQDSGPKENQLFGKVLVFLSKTQVKIP